MDVDLSGLTAEIHALEAGGTFPFGHGENLLGLRRLSTRLEAFINACVSEFDTAGDWAESGATSASAWLSTEEKLPVSEARREVRRSRGMRHMPEAARSWSEGTISEAHIDALLSLRKPATQDDFDRDEPMLVKMAMSMPFEDFKRATAYWMQKADQDGAEESDMEKRARRDIFLFPSLGGMYFGQLTLDPISGAIVSGELERIENHLYEEDWKEASERLGRSPQLSELYRTPAQRRCDALVEMATRSATAPAGGRRPAPLFTVFVGYETLHGPICELAEGIVLAPGSLLDWLDRAYVERAVFGLGDRVEVSASARFFTGATRRALDLRDRRCQDAHCDRPARWCQGDHIEEWSKGGKTTQENGRLLCGYHNRLRNQAPPPRRE
jgi:hypothetical protein